MLHSVSPRRVMSRVYATDNKRAGAALCAPPRIYFACPSMRRWRQTSIGARRPRLFGTDAEVSPKCGRKRCLMAVAHSFRDPRDGHLPVPQESHGLFHATPYGKIENRLAKERFEAPLEGRFVDACDSRDLPNGGRRRKLLLQY